MLMYLDSLEGLALARSGPIVETDRRKEVALYWGCTSLPVAGLLQEQVFSETSLERPCTTRRRPCWFGERKDEVFLCDRPAMEAACAIFSEPDEPVGVSF